MIEEVTMEEILSWIGGISILIGFIVMVSKPFTKYDSRLKKVEGYEERLSCLEKDTKLILKATRTLLLHSVTNNSTGELKRMQQEIDEHLINK